MKKQRGQILIEFALILPLFLLMIFGIFYSGMLFYDYIALYIISKTFLVHKIHKTIHKHHQIHEKWLKQKCHKRNKTT